MFLVYRKKNHSHDVNLSNWIKTALYITFVYLCFLVRYYYVECTDFMHDSIKILYINYRSYFGRV